VRHAGGQFEKLYSWINVNDFSNVYSPGFNAQNALLASRMSPSVGFTIPIRARAARRGVT
jgi:hypothetical protein